MKLDNLSEIIQTLDKAIGNVHIALENHPKAEGASTRRKHKRFEHHELKVSFKIKRNQIDIVDHVIGTIFDVSAGGMKLVLKERINCKAQDTIIFSISKPNGQQFLTGSGICVRLEKINELYAIGVQFEEVSK